MRPMCSFSSFERLDDTVSGCRSGGPTRVRPLALIALAFASPSRAQDLSEARSGAVAIDVFAEYAQNGLAALDGTLSEGGRFLVYVWRTWPPPVLLATLVAFVFGNLMWRRRAARRVSIAARQGLLDALPDAAAVFDASGRLTVANERLVSLLPADGALAPLLGTTVAELYARLSADNVAIERAGGDPRGSTADPATNLNAALPSHGRRSLLARERTYGDGELLVSLRRAEPDGETRFHDPLTRLPNRSRLVDELARLCGLPSGNAGGPPHTALEDESAAGCRRPLALIIVDLKGFRQINDTYGRAAGDRLLAQTAVCLRESMPCEALVARIAGDEFAALIELDAAPDARRRTERCVLDLLATLRRGLDLGAMNVPVRASVGIAYAPDHGRDVSSLMGAADSACAHAKRLGNNALSVYSSRRRREAKRRHRLEIGLQRAIVRRELSLQYQPQVDVRSKMTCGMEALLRWRHPELGRVSPVDFIPVAEQTGIITRLGSWVLRQAIDDYQRLARLGMSPAVLSINLSRKQFDDGRIVHEIGDLLERTGFDPGKLCLEITETALFSDSRRLRALLASLTDLGARLAIDDFGVGYSSLLELKDFPIGEVKIDRAFVTDVATDTNSQDIIGAVVSIARSIGAEVVAEGIENQAQFDAIAALGCDRGQGYWLCEPMSATTFPDVVLGAGRGVEQVRRRAGFLTGPSEEPDVVPGS